MKATRVCSVDGCERGGRFVRELCLMHYNRQRRRGELRRLNGAVRLAQSLVVRDSGCIEWTGTATYQGYGQIRFNGRSIGTHRAAWELVNGPIPEGLCVLHHCDNPPCCNVDHLFLGTRTENNADMLAKKRGRNGRRERTHCPQGHAYDEANTYVDSNGWRGCRACTAEYETRRQRPRPLRSAS